ncbi:MAG: arginine--tRNA ligase, partial [Candidatus Eremiobacteraeota bacterium]|nr:arginine--tRNA ligase [Candidatus Eremiobacteraeota bacterium]
MSVRYHDVLTSVAEELRARLEKVAPEGHAAETLPKVVLTPTRESAHGDFATPVALAAGKAWKRNPLEVAQALARDGVARLPDVMQIDAVKPGFVNVRMRPDFWSAVVGDVLRLGAEYGRSQALASIGPILVEFVSANPTGPLVVVQGRSSALGATLVEMFRFAGATAVAETYVNDAGAQIDLLADSLYVRYASLLGRQTPMPENGYAGDYLIEIARRLVDRDGSRWLDAAESDRRSSLGKFGRDMIVAGQRDDLERFRVHFDEWTFESQLHASGAIAEAVDRLRSSGFTYEKDGALWLRSTHFGDDRDRVLVRSDGRPTYLAADAAYHWDKLQRGSRFLLDILGPDHHGYIRRLEALVAAFGFPGSLEVLLAQHVTFKRGGEAVSMSKRAGDLVT